jgi:PAS domain S-box-containing protein
MRKRVLPMLILSIGCLVAASGGALHWLYQSQVDQIRSIEHRQVGINPAPHPSSISSAPPIDASRDADLMNEISTAQAHTRRALWLILSASVAVGAALAAFLYELTGAAEQALAARTRELEEANETTARRDEALRTCSSELSGAVAAIEQRDQALRTRSAELAGAQTELTDARTRLHDSKVALAEARAAMEQRDREARSLSQELAKAGAALEQRVSERSAELAADVAQRDAAAEALRVSEACFRAMFESSTVGMCESDRATGHFLRVNRKLCEITGYSEAELLDRTFLDITHPDDREANREAHRRFRTGEQREYRVEKRYLKKDGSVAWVQVGVSPHAPEAVHVFAVVQDITDRKRAEAALADSERFARSVVDALGEHIAILDSSGRILATNHAWREFTSAGGGEASECGPGANYLAVCDAAAIMDGNEDARAAAAGIRSVLLAQATHFTLEYAAPAPDEARWFEMRVTPFPQEGRARLVVSHHDITERRRARELERERTGLREAVTGMEQVLGVVGHELRTPLAGLRAMSEFLLTDAARGTAEYEQFLNGMSDEVARMSQTVDNLLEAARLNSGKARWNFRAFAVRDVCDEAIDTIRPLIDLAKVAIDLNVDPANLAMRGDAEAIRRLIINLANNARKHTEAGRIALQAAALSDSAGDWVEFVLSDTGCGIAPEIQSRLGEPFALNSGVVGSYSVSGAGLGLAICKSIVAAHGGSLAIDSAPGAGTRITVRLRADLAQAQPPTLAPEPMLTAAG